MVWKHNYANKLLKYNIVGKIPMAEIQTYVKLWWHVYCCFKKQRKKSPWANSIGMPIAAASPFSIACEEGTWVFFLHYSYIIFKMEKTIPNGHVTRIFFPFQPVKWIFGPCDLLLTFWGFSWNLSDNRSYNLVTGYQILSRCTKQKHILRKDLCIMVLFKLSLPAANPKYNLSISLKALIWSEKLWFQYWLNI